MRNLNLVFVLLVFAACNTNKPVNNAEAQAFLDTYTAEYVKLLTASSEAQWASLRRVYRQQRKYRKGTRIS